MSTNCLVTKLKGVVENNNLPKLGEMYFTVKAGSDINNLYIGTNTTDTGELRIVSGTGYFVNENNEHVQQIPMYTSLFSKRKHIVAETDIVVGILPKYKITQFSFDGSDNTANRDLLHNIIIDAEELKFFAGNLDTGNFYYTVNGDFNIEEFNENCKLIDSLSYIKGTGLYGDATSLMERLTSGSLYRSGLREFFRDNRMYADLSKVNCDCYQITVGNNSNVFKWKTTRSSSKIIIAFKTNINFGNDLDAMLINQADCQACPESADPDNFRIVVTGNRTSASDSAVAILKTKGYTVTVNNEVL